MACYLGEMLNEATRDDITEAEATILVSTLKTTSGSENLHNISLYLICTYCTHWYETWSHWI